MRRGFVSASSWFTMHAVAASECNCRHASVLRVRDGGIGWRRPERFVPKIVAARYVVFACEVSRDDDLDGAGRCGSVRHCRCRRRFKRFGAVYALDSSREMLMNRCFRRGYRSPTLSRARSRSLASTNIPASINFVTHGLASSSRPRCFERKTTPSDPITAKP